VTDWWWWWLVGWLVGWLVVQQPAKLPPSFFQLPLLLPPVHCQRPLRTNLPFPSLVPGFPADNQPTNHEPADTRLRPQTTTTTTNMNDCWQLTFFQLPACHRRHIFDLRVSRGTPDANALPTFLSLLKLSLSACPAPCIQSKLSEGVQ